MIKRHSHLQLLLKSSNSNNKFMLPSCDWVKKDAKDALS